MSGLLLKAAVFLVCTISVKSCSCPRESLSRSSQDDIIDSLCHYQSRDIYRVSVTEATCNCLPKAGFNQQQLYCQRDTGSGTLVVLARTVCTDRTVATAENVGGCGVSLPSELDHPPIIDRTSPSKRCPYTCRFNFILFEIYSTQPCYYTIRVEEVFRGSKVVGSVESDFGPDVISSCGTFGRRLSVGKQYIVGLGGPCSRIMPWSEISSFSYHDLSLLQEYRENPSNFCYSSTINLSPTPSSTSSIHTQILVDSPTTISTSQHYTDPVYSLGLTSTSKMEGSPLLLGSHSVVSLPTTTQPYLSTHWLTTSHCTTCTTSEPSIVSSHPAPNTMIHTRRAISSGLPIHTSNRPHLSATPTLVVTGSTTKSLSVGMPSLVIAILSSIFTL